MKNKAILIVAGEPNSIFLEIFFKSLKKNNFKRPIILIASKNLVAQQMKKLRFNFKINLIDTKKIVLNLLTNKELNIINVDYKFKKVFDKISESSNLYIKNSFDIGPFINPINLLVFKRAKAISKLFLMYELELSEILSNTFLNL